MRIAASVKPGLAASVRTAAFSSLEDNIPPDRRTMWSSLHRSYILSESPNRRRASMRALRLGHPASISSEVSWSR